MKIMNKLCKEAASEVESAKNEDLLVLVQRYRRNQISEEKYEELEAKIYKKYESILNDKVRMKKLARMTSQKRQITLFAITYPLFREFNTF